MRHLLLILRGAPLLLASVATPAEAQSRLTGFDLLRMTPSARAASLAGAFTAGGPGASPDALFYSPAFLGEDAHGLLSIGYLNHVDDIWMGFAAYTRDVEQLGGTAGVAIRHLNFGDFRQTSFEGADEGSFGASETAFTVSFARPVAPRFRVGGNLHAVLVSLADHSASALAADVGAMYHVPEAGLVASLTLRNAGLVLSSLGDSDDRLPVDLRLAVSKQLPNVPLRLTLTGYDLNRFEAENGSVLNEFARHLAFSGEFFLGQAFAVRLGYDFRRGDELSTGERLDLAGLGAGFGLNLRRFGFDYAYNAWSSFGGLHHLTLRAAL
jgi:hypothetical protein